MLRLARAGVRRLLAAARARARAGEQARSTSTRAVDGYDVLPGRRPTTRDALAAAAELLVSTTRDEPAAAGRPPRTGRCARPASGTRSPTGATISPTLARRRDADAERPARRRRALLPLDRVRRRAGLVSTRSTTAIVALARPTARPTIAARATEVDAPLRRGARPARRPRRRDTGRRGSPRSQARTRRCSARTSGSSPSSRSPPRRAASGRRARGQSTDGELLGHLTRTELDFPVDDWLHGVARVREQAARPRAGRPARRRSSAGPSPTLTPIQLPHVPASPGSALRVPGRPRRSTASALLYTAHYSVPFAKAAQPVRPAARRVDGGRSPATSETTGIAFHYDRPDSEPPQAMLCSLPPDVGDGTWQWDDLVGALHRDARPRAAPRRRARPARRARRTARFLPATIIGARRCTADLDRASTSPRERRRCRRRPSAMAERRRRRRTSAPRSSARLYPTVTVWNRLEGRPRTRDFERALQAEVRDALWMLSRQWQLGEFAGDDAARRSPRSSQLATTRADASTGRATAGAGAVRRRPAARGGGRAPPVPLAAGGAPLALDLRLAMGRQWLALVEPIGELPPRRSSTHYPIEPPDPDDPADARSCAHPEAWAGLRRGRRPRAWTAARSTSTSRPAPGNHAYDGVVGIDPDDHDALDDGSGRVRRVVRAT